MLKSKNKTNLLIISRVLFSLILLALLFWLARENLHKIWGLLKATDLGFYTLSATLFLLTIGLLSWRLKILLSAQGGEFSIPDIFSLNLIGYFFTNFMPTTIGGDVVKGLLISQKTKSRVLAYAAIIADRIIGMFSLSLIAGIALLIAKNTIEQKFIFWVVGLFLLICLLTLLFLAHKGLSSRISGALGLARISRKLKIETAAKKAYQAMNIYTDHKDKVWQSFLISLLTHFITFVSVYVLVLSLGMHIPFVRILLMMPIIIVLCMLPVTMNGLGLREWAFVLFFRANIGNAAALSLSLLYLSLFLLVSIVGGFAYLLRR